MLPIYQLLRPHVVAVDHQEVEGKERWFTTMEKEITKLRSTLMIDADNFTVENCLARMQRDPFQIRSPLKSVSALPAVPNRETRIRIGTTNRGTSQPIESRQLSHRSFPCANPQMFFYPTTRRTLNVPQTNVVPSCG